ncbi:MAG: CAP domain-containing protein [Sphingobacteriaceae bacterium]|nr:CAP domain-containing protein [Sphingobacteriaceae bacterium]
MKGLSIVLLSKKNIVLVSMVLFLIASCRKDEAIPDGKIEFAMLDSVNKLRSAGCNCGNDIMPPVQALIWNSPLAKAAEAHAKDMYTRKYFEHMSPEGTSALQRAIAAGYQGTTVLENIGKGYINIGSVMLAWKASESHCKAMMDAASTDMGAYSYNGYWVQEFGK